MPRTAANALVETLAARGADRIFCVPGESFLAVLDALYDAAAIDVVTCRHESGAGFMALADAKLTRRPGIAFASRGPGACNAAIAVHSAQQDAAPLLLFLGQVPRGDRHRGAFQEVDYGKTFADMAKWVVEIDDPARIPELVARAWQIAVTPTAGPVVVALPEDMLAAPCDAEIVPPQAEPVAVAGAAAVERAVAMLAAAERPVLLAGGEIHDEAGRQALQAVAERWAVPVASTSKRQDVFPNDHPNWIGQIGYVVPKELAAALRGADLVLAVGTRLGDVSSQGWTFPRAPVPEQPLVHVYPDPAQLGRVFATALAVPGDAGAFLAALAERNPPPASTARRAWVGKLHGIDARLQVFAPVETADGVDFGHVVTALARHLPADAIIAQDAGNFGGWLHRHFPFKTTQRLLGCIAGAMGGGVPGAVAAALRHPGRAVACVVGDGGFLMTGNELATAVQRGAAIKVFVANNGSYGTIRTHQERHYPGRRIATDLANPDFAALAHAFGATGLRLDRAADADRIVREALAAPGPVVVDVATSLERISAYTTLSAIRGAG